jgi:heme O synthase-like polyprenyltransferase
MGWLYFVAAAVGGLLFVERAWRLQRNQSRLNALRCFHASLVQLSLLLIATFLELLW